MPRQRFEIFINVHNNHNNNAILNPYALMRRNLYRYAFFRVAVVYAKLVPEFSRKLMEFLLLVIALFSFFTLVYVHVQFVQKPGTCFDAYEDFWDTNSVLRVEVLRNKKDNYSLNDSYLKEATLRIQKLEGTPLATLLDTKPVDKLKPGKKPIEEEIDKTVDKEEQQQEPPWWGNFSFSSISLLEALNEDELNEDSTFEGEYEYVYIIEFSPEYGYLRLHHSKRQELNISVGLITLDPDNEVCFGNILDRFLLENFLGYDNILLESIKSVVQKKEYKGFIRNIVMQVEYAFVSAYANEKSFVTALFVMLLFTLIISMLLRHSNHQIFIIVANVLNVSFPRALLQSTGAPVLTVILALVGTEAVMSEFFNDRTLAVYVIAIVWQADMFESVCCQSDMSKRHWFRFFYLYHFLFYAYNYKFGGAYWPLSLMTSYFFIMHSMLWFFHHYELPRMLRRHRNVRARHNHRNNNNNNNNDPANGQENGTQNGDDRSSAENQPSTSSGANGTEPGSGETSGEPESSPPPDSSGQSSSNATDCSAPDSVRTMDSFVSESSTPKHSTFPGSALVRGDSAAIGSSSETRYSSMPGASETKLCVMAGSSKTGYSDRSGSFRVKYSSLAGSPKVRDSFLAGSPRVRDSSLAGSSRPVNLCTSGSNAKAGFFEQIEIYKNGSALEFPNPLRFSGVPESPKCFNKADSMKRPEKSSKNETHLICCQNGDDTLNTELRYAVKNLFSSRRRNDPLHKENLIFMLLAINFMNLKVRNSTPLRNDFSSDLTVKRKNFQLSDCDIKILFYVFFFLYMMLESKNYSEEKFMATNRESSRALVHA